MASTPMPPAPFDTFATKADLALLKSDIMLLEQRLTNKIDRAMMAIGGMIAVAVSVLAALDRFLH
jgi:hypothetical protein